MAKPTQSITTPRGNVDVKTPPPENGPRGKRKPIPQARRGSVTKPVPKGTRWLPLALSGGLLALAAIVIVVLVVAHRGSATGAQRPPPVASPVAGAAAPDFNVQAKDGSTLTRADLAGQPTLMVFFASWCPHCQAETPRIKALAAANPDVKVVFIGVSDRETQDDIYNFQQKFGLPFPTYYDGGKAASAYGVGSYPTLMAVDKSGTIRAVETGEKTPAQLNTMLAKAKQ